MKQAMITFEVNDMTCGHCVGNITRALKATDKDIKVQIDLATHRVQVQAPAADNEELAAAIKGAGYTPVSLEEPTRKVEATELRSCCGHCQ